MPNMEEVVDALNDPIRSGSYNMRVLRVLLKAEQDGGTWLTPAEIALAAGIPVGSVGSRIRELRTDGFIIKRNKRAPFKWEYRVFFATQGN